MANRFLSGQILNSSVLSWNGSNGNRSVTEMLRFLYQGTEDTNFNFFPDLSGNFTGLYYDKFLIPYGLCQTFEGQPPSFMAIGLKDVRRSTYNIHITDPAASTTFQLPYSLMSGAKLVKKSSRRASWASFNIKITEKILQTNDGTCIDYPNARHKSYSDCVDAELQGKIVPTLGCMVPWMSDVNTCSQPILRLAHHERLLKWILNMALKSYGHIEYSSAACRLPCNLMLFHVNKASSGSSAFSGKQRGVFRILVGRVGARGDFRHDDFFLPPP